MCSGEWLGPLLRATIDLMLAAAQARKTKSLHDKVKR